MSKLKAFAGDKINVSEKLKFVFSRAENTVGKGKMLVTSIFSEGLFLKVIKSLDCVEVKI